MAITTNVPSNSFEDLKRDVEDATKWVNGTEPFQNRVGETVKPIPVIQQEWDQSTSGQFLQQAQVLVTQAEVFASQAERSAEAASATGRIYDLPAAGQADAGLTNGAYYWVVSASDSEVLELWRKGASTPIDTGKRTVNSEFVIDIIGKGEVDEIIHAFTDKNGKMVALINKDGEFQAKFTDEVKDSFNIIKGNDDDDFALIITDSMSRVIFSLSKDGFADLGLTHKNSDNDNAYVFLDSSGKVVAYIDNQGKLVAQAVGLDQSPITPTGSDLNRSDVYPQKVPISSINQAVTATAELVQSSLPIQLTAKGRSGDPDILVNGNGLTHPKVIYIPGGWNGYEYWMAVTPYFGIIGTKSEYENPHVLSSNDLINWVEPSGGRIDVPEDGNGSYWSDTHLAIADDGYMYCWYRGNNFSFSGRFYAYKRSRDGVNWSERVITTSVADPKFNVISSNAILSPCIFIDGQKWVCYDLIWSQASGLTIPPSNTSTAVHVLRRTDNYVSSDFGPFSVDQVVNYSTREWGSDSDPWHLDAIKVGNLYIHLINVGAIGSFFSNRLYLAYSTDGWNFIVLPKLALGVDNFYRSSIHLESIDENKINLILLAARTTGSMDLYKLTLEVN